MTKSIVTMGDAAYFPSMALSAMQAEQFHPDCIFGIYDWGLAQEQRDFLRSRKNVRLIDWTGRFRRRPFPDSFPAAVIRIIRSAADPSVKAGMLMLQIRTLGDLLGRDRGGKEWMLAQKPYCFLDWATKPDIDRFVFLDGDAFLVAPIDELFEADFDLGVTVRRSGELNFALGNCQLVNSGVIAFAATRRVTQTVIEAWIHEMGRTHEYLVEQTALSRLILRHGVEASMTSGTYVTLRLEGSDVLTKLLDCDTYNFNWVEEGVDPQRNKIVHLKGARHSGEQFREQLRALADAIGLEEHLAKIATVGPTS